MILDTSFIIDYIEGKKSAKRKYDKLKAEEEKIILTPVNSYELYKGAEKYYKTGKEQEKIEKALEKIPAEKVPISWVQGKETANIENRLKENGNMIETLDIMIAALAFERDELVLTGNPDHFEKVEGIEVESY
ncbi:MAG: PIN domain-containing protein [Candidatus Nanohalobium sp.]